jgi:hypothetical protein
MVTQCSETRNRRGEAVQMMTAKLAVLRRGRAKEICRAQLADNPASYSTTISFNWKSLSKIC